MTETTNAPEWRETAVAARFLRLDPRSVQRLIKKGVIGAREKVSGAMRPTYEVFWPDVVEYDHSRSQRAIHGNAERGTTG